MSINDERAAIVYYAVRRENEKQGKDKVSLEDFLDTYEKFFSMISKNPYANMNINKKAILEERKKRYTEIHKQLMDATLEETLAYRNKFIRIASRDIPEDLCADANAKGLYVLLKRDTDTFLSGYNISYKQKSVTSKPWTLTESQVRKIVKDFPTSKEALVKQETNLLNVLHDDTRQKSHKKSALDRFKMIYTTHDFQVKINRYLKKYCTDKDLALSAIGLCSRAGIVNLENNKPLMLRFCKADSKAKRQLNKRIKRARGRKESIR